MRLNGYRFRDTWFLPAPRRAVFDAVADLEGYPRWWPDVRSVRKIDEDTAELVCRATLPYRLVIRMRRAEQDASAGRLRVHLDGDLQGSLAARVLGHPRGTTLDITQEVVATKPLLRRLSPVARPLFQLNHALMMRRGRRGLLDRLA
ncbi:Polyketide cyclase / dehydrase and lipid transport [Amycolatopsis sacchari]|uniref:Polyketide cyclase / dehydrase and lipid transport n=1 Tax=Amycolatopsis sacchari TaxID=115433 RepID=A0A1I3ZAS3_9PSEU|nr:SRPBCC family protein [Amycolatopsis sacchari]SFK41103.1 Polyketide cyclase / dehydrase and lipid transport [Amycolatopsis sacchari]